MTVRNPQPRASHLLGATLIVSLAVGLAGQPARAGQPAPADPPSGIGSSAAAGPLAAAVNELLGAGSLAAADGPVLVVPRDLDLDREGLRTVDRAVPLAEGAS